MNQGLAAFALHWPTSICVNAHGVINLSKISIFLNNSGWHTYFGSLLLLRNCYLICQPLAINFFFFSIFSTACITWSFPCLFSFFVSYITNCHFANKDHINHFYSSLKKLIVL